MEQIINPSDETKLVRAIEKAASRTTVNENLDRDQVLADELKAARVPTKFAKVAAAAYNKRITVLTFKQREDAEREKPFTLADGDKVASLMDPSGIIVEASERPSSDTFVFEAKTEKPGNLAKTASQNSVTNRLPFEYRVDKNVFLDKLESMVDLHTGLVEGLIQKQASLECQLREECTKLAETLVKKAFDFDVLRNLHGSALEHLMKEYMPKDTSFEKTASGAIRPSGDLYNKVDELLKKRATFDEQQAFLQDYITGLSEFSQGVIGFTDRMEKKAVGITPLYHTVNVANAGIGALGSLGTTMIDSYEDRLNQATELWQKGVDNSKHPASVIDSELLYNDRYRDRMLGWADMAADPQFSMYPAEEVFNATQKAMNIDMSHYKTINN